MSKSTSALVAEVLINAPIEKIWELWTNPLHIAKWNNLSDKWYTPKAENDFRVGGRLFLRMELKDGSDGFDYHCIYDEIVMYQKISHTSSDNRKTTVLFTTIDNAVRLTETFEPDNHTPLDVQQSFCQSILNNFKNHVEEIR